MVIKKLKILAKNFCFIFACATFLLLQCGNISAQSMQFTTPTPSPSPSPSPPPDGPCCGQSCMSPTPSPAPSDSPSPSASPSPSPSCDLTPIVCCVDASCSNGGCSYCYTSTVCAGCESSGVSCSGCLSTDSNGNCVSGNCNVNFGDPNQGPTTNCDCGGAD